MKTGIITFHCADNYGAVLQCYALQTKLRELFQDAEVFIIDYRPKYIMKMFSLIKTHHVLYFFNSLLQMPFRLLIKMRFNRFRAENYMYLRIKDAAKLDYIVCGSDQIWNPLITQGFDRHYFGFFDGFPGGRIAYAASDGGNLAKTGNSAGVQALLKNFAALSVREKSMLPALEALGVTGTAVPDPVLLLDKFYWAQKAARQKYHNYILIYRVLPNDDIVRDANIIAEKTGKRIVELRFGIPYKNLPSVKHTIVPAAGVYDFLSLFLHAGFVLTNSFHGTAFSIIFNKQFCSYSINDSIQNRIVDLLSDLGISDRYVKTGLPKIFDTIDYASVNGRIAQKSQKASEFLLNAFAEG
jgi:hypothetical protein